MFENEKVLVIGLGISGIACIKGLNSLGAKIIAYDSLPEEKLADKLSELEKIDVEYHFEHEEFDIEDIDIAIKSPGVKYEIPLIQRLLEKNKKVISDLEAAYKLSKAPIVSITGTNGKTTTTTLIGEIVRESGRVCRVTGNIGVGIFADCLEAGADEVIIAEVSSFQLAGTYTFKPHVSVMTNITPDHLDFHHTLEGYYEAKFKNVVNQDENDYAVLNYEDELIREYSKNIKAKKIYFSSERVLEEGIFVQNNEMVFRQNKETTFITAVSDIFIPGKHNLENAMAAAGACLAIKIKPDIIKKVLEEFRGVEHRLEYLGEYGGVKFYNDSKGTNPDASVKAVQGIEKPIVLIAGGYNKGSEFDDFIEAFDDKVKSLVLLGQTADLIEQCALKHGFTDIHKVKNMDEAVKKCFEISKKGDNVVLSPACASWGMYPNYEVRGQDFKERVKYYGGRKKSQ